MEITFNMSGWQKVVKKVVDEVLVPKAKAIADECNKEMQDEYRSEHGESMFVPASYEDGYVAGTVSINGGNALTKRDYRATVITRTKRAMIDNARFDRLIKNLFLASENASRFSQFVHGVANARGGITIDLNANSPTEGYAYAPSKFTETKVAVEDFSVNDVNSFIDNNFQDLRQPGNNLGLWVQDGFVYIDISRVGPATPETIRAAQDAQQLGVFDLKNFQTIETGRMENGKFVRIPPP